MLHFSKSFPMKNQTHLHLAWLEAWVNFQQIFNYAFNWNCWWCNSFPMLMSQAYCGLNPKTWCEKENGSSWRRMKSKQAGKQPEISVKVIRTWNVKHGGIRLNFREQLPSQHVWPTSGQQLLVSNMKRINVTAVNVRCTPSNTWSIVTSQTYDTE